MVIGYCRVSTAGQSLDRQLDQLTAAGCERVYQEKVSGASKERSELTRLNKMDGYVICPRCLQYNREERATCVHCGFPLDHPINGGVVRVPGFGTVVDTKKPVDNEMMRKYSLLFNIKD